MTDLDSFEAFLGPMSLRRTYTGFRTIAGQIPVVVTVNPPIRLIFDESDNSLEFRFSTSPLNDFCNVCWIPLFASHFFVMGCTTSKSDIQLGSIKAWDYNLIWEAKSISG